jgi:flagellar hook-associated protein 2
MSSGITFSGFNSIDFGTVLNLVMQQERAPLTALETRKSSLETQNSAFATFATKLGALESAAAALARPGSLSGLTATSSNASVVGVSATSGAVAGSYDVVVSSIARAQVTVSETSFAAIDTVVGSSGTIVIAGRDAESTIEITLDGETTLTELANKINREAGSPVSASIVRVASGDYRLVLTGKSTGVVNQFTIEVTNPLAGGSGLSFLDLDGDGISGNSPGDNTQNAVDAVFTVNNLQITSDSNTVTDVIPGATLTLFQTSTEPVRVDVARDEDAAVGAAQKLVTAYNDVLSFIKSQTNDVAAGKAGIGRDPLVRGLRDALRATLSADYGGVLSRLSQIGIAPDRDGVLQLDEKVFREALAASPNDVQHLLTGADGKSGFAGAMQTMLKRYTSIGGLVADARNRLDAQLLALRDRITVMEERLEQRRLTLQQEFAAADRAMSQLNSQASSLTSLAAQFRLF